MWFFRVLSDRETPFYPTKIGKDTKDFRSAYERFESEVEKCQRFIDTTGRTGLRYKKRTIYLMSYTLDNQGRYDRIKYIYLAKTYKKELVLKDLADSDWIQEWINDNLILKEGLK